MKFKVLSVIFLLTLSKIAFADDLIKSPNNLFVFVGELVGIEEFDPEISEGVIFMDSAFEVKFKIISTLYGKYQGGSQITFNAYDHYGFPSFAKYRTVLMFVSEQDGRLYHVKYEYYDIYRTTDNRWATCGNPYEFEEDIEPKPISNIEFDKTFYHDVSLISKQFAKIEFPSPMYQIVGDKAYCKQGVYAEDLFELSKKTTLYARGLFE